MSDITKFLEQMTKESEIFRDEMKPLVIESECKLEDILGFNLSEKKVRADLSSDNISLRSALTLYDEVLIMIYPKITSNEEMENIYHFSIDELSYLAETGRIIVCFNHPYEKYKHEVIIPFLKPGIRHISSDQFELLTYHDVSNIEYLEPPLLYEAINEFPKLKNAPYCFNILLANGFYEPFQNILKNIENGSLSDITPECIICYSMYAHRFLDSSKMKAVKLHDFPECALFNKLFKEITLENCILTKGYFGSNSNIDSVCEGLNISYSKEIPLEDYIEIVDGNTTKANRKIMKDILNDPTNIKYRQRLFSSVYELNQEVEELGNSKLVKLGVTTTDIIGYYLKNVAPDGVISSGLEWLAEKSLKLQAKLLRKDWAILQLYRTRKNIRK